MQHLFGDVAGAEISTAPAESAHKGPRLYDTKCAEHLVVRVLLRVHTHSETYTCPTSEGNFIQHLRRIHTFRCRLASGPSTDTFKSYI